MKNKVEEEIITVIFSRIIYLIYLILSGKNQCQINLT